MELVCPVCVTHPPVAALPVAESAVVCTCGECGAIFTVQVGAARMADFPLHSGSDPSDSSPGGVTIAATTVPAVPMIVSD